MYVAEPHMVKDLSISRTDGEGQKEKKQKEKKRTAVSFSVGGDKNASCRRAPAAAAARRADDRSGRANVATTKVFSADPPASVPRVPIGRETPRRRSIRDVCSTATDSTPPPPRTCI